MSHRFSDPGLTGRFKTAGLLWLAYLCLAFGSLQGAIAQESAAQEPATREAETREAERQESELPDEDTARPEGEGEPDPEAEVLTELDQRLRQVEEKLGQLDAEGEDDEVDQSAESDASDEEREQERSERRRTRYERRVSVGDRVRVRKGETVSEVVAAGGPVEIEGEVEGDVTSWGGDVTIDGTVGGDVKAYRANIELEDDADVLGSVISYGGDIDRDPEASVLGVVDERSFAGRLSRDRDDLVFDDAREQRRRRSSRVVRWDQLFEMAWLALGLSLLFLLAAFTLLVAPDPMERLRRTIGRELWKCGLVGLAVVISAVPIFAILVVFLAVLLIGIPLIPVVVFLYMLTCFVAVVAAAYALGRRLSSEGASPYWSLGVGSFLLVFPLVAAEGLGFLSFLDPLAILMKVFGWMLIFAAGTIGVGALMLTSFGTRTSWQGSRGTPGFVPPPPPPKRSGGPASPIAEEESGPLDAILDGIAPPPPAPEAAQQTDEVETSEEELDQKEDESSRSDDSAGEESPDGSGARN